MSLHRSILSCLGFALLASACSGGGSQPAAEAASTTVTTKKALDPLPSDPAAARRALMGLVASTPSPVVVVALDGETLFFSAARNQRIFFEVLAEMGQMELMRTMMDRVKAGEVLRNQAALVRASGLTDPRALDLIKRRFNERLHSDAYIPDDKPRAGASAFFKALHQAGAQLVFVSSDDLVRSGPGWVQLLRNQGLPILAPGAYLMLPPRPDAMNEAFLKRRDEAIAKLGTVIATFHVLQKDGEALAAAFPGAHGIAVQPATKADRKGWADFGSAADWAPKAPAKKTP